MLCTQPCTVDVAGRTRKAAIDPDLDSPLSRPTDVPTVRGDLPGRTDTGRISLWHVTVQV